ncbi:SGNH/GDSL hydrolase family protein [Mucilaginibacter sp. McL0603]|uniref:SGNH/GDSL hydrolase family protein n=1 Tax=Mucilaginibacter sp. McL0603 TaxID=3415670 RepID=UPI003CF6F5AE
MTNADTTVKASDSTFTYLALGDSYTIGQSVPADQSYPNLLALELTAHKYPVNPPKIIAVTGWTTDELINAIASSGITDKKFDFVTLLIGVNDQYQQLSQDNYRTKFQQVLNTAIKFADGNKNRVFVLSIPDWGVTPFAAGRDSIIGPQIDQFNAINKQISNVAQVNYINVTTISRLAANNPSLIASDGLHPSEKMYQLWVDLLEPVVIAKLR